MNLDTLLSPFHNHQLYQEFATLGDNIGRLSTIQLIMVVAMIAIGLMWCFLGHKMIRFWAVLLGLGYGFLLGSSLAGQVSNDAIVIAIIGVIVGLIIALVSAIFLKVGIFIFAALAVMTPIVTAIQPQSTIVWIVCLVIALAAAVVAVILATPFLILVTAFFGAVMTVFQVGYLLNLDMPARIVAIGVLFLIGGMVQFAMANGKRKRSELSNAQAVQIERAKHTNVDAARNFLDEETPTKKE